MVNGKLVSADEFNAMKNGNFFGRGSGSVISNTKKTFLVNGKPVTEEEFNRLKNGFPSAFPPSKFPQPNYPSKSTKGEGSYSSKPHENEVIDEPPKQPYKPPKDEERSIIVDRKPHKPSHTKGEKTPQGNIKLTEGAKKACVDVHNKYRQQLALGRVPNQPRATQMSPLEWDEKLSQVAGKWASKCVFKHANTDDYCGINNHESVGENLGTGTMFVSEELTTEEQVIDKLTTHITNWFMEHEDYNYYRRSCNPGKKCGHYTQVVSDRSETVGCAIAMCKNGVQLFTGSRAYLVACNYGPAGNYVGQAPYESEKKDCPKKRPKRDVKTGFCVGKGKEDIVCKDTSVGCSQWKREGKCAMCHNPYYKSVVTQCPKTCGKCE